MVSLLTLLESHLAIATLQCSLSSVQFIKAPLLSLVFAVPPPLASPLWNFSAYFILKKNWTNFPQPKFSADLTHLSQFPVSL